MNRRQALRVVVAVVILVALVTVLNVAATTVTLREQVAAQWQGRPAPALVGPRVDGQGGSLDLGDLRGAPVLVEFFATWCPSCAAHAALSATLAKDAPGGLRVLLVALDGANTAAAVPAWLAQHAPTVPAIHQPLAAAGWGINQVPAFFLVNAQGRIAASHLLGADPAGTEQAIRAAVSALVTTKEHA